MSHLIPHGDTAIRLGWKFLPPHIRAEVERRCGSPVVSSVSCDAGFTPGLASVLTCADSSRHFIKAAAAVAQRTFADAYREEARILAGLPARVPAPRLRWVIDEDWFVLCTEFVDSTQPARPWSVADLDATLDTCERLAAATTPAPAVLSGKPFTQEAADLLPGWDLVSVEDLPAPAGADHLSEAVALAGRCREVLDGDTLVHSDLRDDNVLLRPDGTALFCDWNWPARGADWFDSLAVLIGPRGDGLDVTKVMAERPLLRDVPGEHVDIALALMCGHFLGSATQPVPASSPWLRTAQRWQGEVVWSWLAERRGWS